MIYPVIVPIALISPKDMQEQVRFENLGMEVPDSQPEIVFSEAVIDMADVESIFKTHNNITDTEVVIITLLGQDLNVYTTFEKFNKIYSHFLRYKARSVNYENNLLIPTGEILNYKHLLKDEDNKEEAVS